MADLNTHARIKLAKLVLMLSSDQPGEVVAAKFAIERALSNEGCTWHDLAEIVGEKGAPAYVPPMQPADETISVPAMLSELYAYRYALVAKEQDFIEQMVRKGDYSLTDRQFSYLVLIYGKYLMSGGGR